jgi:putative transcriptional regulator
MKPASLSESRDFNPDKETKHLVELCLHIPAVPKFTGKHIKALRERYEITQSFLATVLNVSPVTVRQWEGEARHPNSQCSKLLDLLDRKGLHALI